MESKELAQGRKLPVMVVAVAMALTVNSAFALALIGTPTSGQRMYDAWYKSGGSTMVASAAAEPHKVCPKS